MADSNRREEERRERERLERERREEEHKRREREQWQDRTSESTDGAAPTSDWMKPDKPKN
jgi:hypothetical protein